MQGWLKSYFKYPSYIFGFKLSKPFFVRILIWCWILFTSFGIHRISSRWIADKKIKKSFWKILWMFWMIILIGRSCCISTYAVLSSIVSIITTISTSSVSILKVNLSSVMSLNCYLSTKVRCFKYIYPGITDHNALADYSCAGRSFLDFTILRVFWKHHPWIGQMHTLTLRRSQGAWHY